MSRARTFMHTPSMLNLLQLKLIMAINSLAQPARAMKTPSPCNATVKETLSLVELTLRPRKCLAYTHIIYKDHVTTTIEKDRFRKRKIPVHIFTQRKTINLVKVMLNGRDFYEPRSLRSI